ncbi:hypothetical protein [Acinetobacter tjernbergiae]|uniref:Uncharacterized protein n=1 Tax=Acinetobacter tjernbergiae DSM 14971 = CIP 107465 TaxID=1120928 RepID=V2USA4_9GAMM|nr:hypothetical protein [Acinetobacter tjernbergiae]ESK57613.1 hypothetical protein F990_00149 [Acinetobacter tjernbergiae DSM 14971 = CIP 107465]MBH2029727.1 hypothetical protein [Moraxellaceae bacterium]
MSKKIRSNSDGIQFSIQSGCKSPSTTHTAKQILKSALQSVDSPYIAQLTSEKNWRKNYPFYFQEIVRSGIDSIHHPLCIAQHGLNVAKESFSFNRGEQHNTLNDAMHNFKGQPFEKFILKGTGSPTIEPWFIPYNGKKLQGEALIQQINLWEQQQIIEPSHAKALHLLTQHPEWFDLSKRTMVLFGAGSEAGPLSWLAKWRANIIAIDLPQTAIWEKITKVIQQGNATLIAPKIITENNQQQLGANLLTQTPEIANWLNTFTETLDLAGIAYLDGEKHVRVSIAMISIMEQVSLLKSDSSIMFMLTPTDIYAIPKSVVQSVQQRASQRSLFEKLLTKSIHNISLTNFFRPNTKQLIESDNGQQYGIADCMVIEQGPNYALAKRLQQWFAICARARGQKTVINIAPSTTTHSVVKNPILKAAFSGADLFKVETFNPETTNAIMAALWVHDLNNPESASNPETQLNHPLELIMENANHGGLWHVSYLARTALPFAAAYGWLKEKL